MDDYEHVMMTGPWMLGDNYVVIREWVPNFIPEEDTITRLMAWVRIPKLSAEYFNKHFLLNKIGKKIGKVVRVDSTTENVERGQYTRLCVEVDLTKPLLSKFGLNGRVWKIQYEGLRMVCFKCGKQGHREDGLGIGLFGQDIANESNPVAIQAGAHTENTGFQGDNEDTYGSWMLVRRTNKKRPQRLPIQGDDRARSGTLGHETRTWLEAHRQPNMATKLRIIWQQFRKSILKISRMVLDFEPLPILT